MIPPLELLPETASQTAGPYVHIGLSARQAGFDIYQHTIGNDLLSANTAGERIRVEGVIRDGAGTLVKDALVELWQADAAGRYAHPADLQSGERDPRFRGYGRACTDFNTGLYAFHTIKPGKVPARGNRWLAPHLNLWIVARGINIGLHTRMYFHDEAEANAADPVLNAFEWRERQATLIAARQEREGATVYRFDIHLQGPHETVFFDV